MDEYPPANRCLSNCVCCRGAFLSAAKHFVEKDLEVSMAGRVFMITGANSGIGRATAMAIAKRGTVCVCRVERVCVSECVHVCLWRKRIITFHRTEYTAGSATLALLLSPHPIYRWYSPHGVQEQGQSRGGQG